MSMRAFMDETGFVVAKPGFDARTTGPTEVLFSSDYAAMGIYMSGVIELPLINWNSHTTVIRGATLEYGKTFTHPPVVWLCGIGADFRDVGVGVNASYYTAASYYFRWQQPNWQTISYADRCLLWVNRNHGSDTGETSLGCTHWRYFVMENLIE